MASVVAAKPVQASQSVWSLGWRRFKKHRAAMASMVVVVLLILMALFAPVLSPYDPKAQPTSGDLASQYFNPPNPTHLLGTDELGRDVLSRVIWGSRISLLVGIVAALVSSIIGIVIGVIAGFYSGRPFRFYYGPLNREASAWAPVPFAVWRVISWVLLAWVLWFVATLSWSLAGSDVQDFFSGDRSFSNLLSLFGLIVGWGLVVAIGIWGLRGRFDLDLDIALSRFTDFMLTIPTLPLLLVLSALLRDTSGPVGRWSSSVFGESASVFIILTIIVLFGWITTARLIRGSVLSLREQEFTTAAQALGAGDGRIMFRHLVPNTLAPLIVNTTLSVGDAILTEAALSFLGFGIQPPVATWGNMLTNSLDYVIVNNTPWLAFVPGFMIFLTVLAFNYLGDGLRDALDPRSRL